jgi:hypothetical protein
MLILALSLVGTHPAEAASKFRNPDAKRDWHGVRWGSSPTSEMACKPGGIKDVTVCTLPASSGDTAVGAVTASSVTYNFFEKRLYRIDVAIPTDDAGHKIGSALAEVYGPGSINPLDGRSIWKGDVNQISWGLNLRAVGGTLTYEYLPLLGDFLEAQAKDPAAGLEAIGNDI